MKTENEKAYEKYCEKYASYFDTADEAMSDVDFQKLVVEAGESLELIESLWGTMSDTNDIPSSIECNDSSIYFEARTLQNNMAHTISTTFTEVFHSINDAANSVLVTQKLMIDFLVSFQTNLRQNIDAMSEIVESIKSIDEISIPVECSTINDVDQELISSETYAQSFTLPTHKSSNIIYSYDNQNEAA